MTRRPAVAGRRRLILVNRYFDPDQSATSQLLGDLARGLAARGHETHVVCSRQLYDDASVRLAANDTRAGVRIHRVATTHFGRGGMLGRAIDYASFYLTCTCVLLKLVRGGDVLVAKTDPPLLSLLAAPLARFRGAALVNWQQDVFPEVASQLGANPLPPWLDRCLRRLRDASLRAAAMNVVIGERMLEYFAGRGIPERRLCVIANWADGEAIKPKAAAASTLRARLGLADRFVVGYSGNLGRAHEFETVLGAARMLEADSRVVFLFIGGGARMDALKSAVARHGLTAFRFLPYQPRDALADSLAAADVHLVSLLPSLEGLIVPSKLYGILAAGRPLILIGDAGGEVGRVIERAQCGRVVGVGDAPGLCEALRGLETDPAELARMGARAGQLFGAEYGLERALERWIAVIEAV